MEDEWLVPAVFLWTEPSEAVILLPGSQGTVDTVFG